MRTYRRKPASSTLIRYDTIRYEYRADYLGLHRRVALRVSACSLLQGRKERRRYSVNRSFYGDYINMEAQPMLRRLLNDKRERVEFADRVTKYDRRGKVASPTSSTVCYCAVSITCR